jgi:hypothetical protein
LLKALQKNSLASLAAPTTTVNSFSNARGRKRRQSTVLADEDVSAKDSKRARLSGGGADASSLGQFSRRTSNDSISSTGSSRSKASAGNTRGAEMMRQSRRNQEEQKNRRSNDSDRRGSNNHRTILEMEKESYRMKAEAEMAPLVKGAKEAVIKVKMASPSDEELERVLLDEEENIMRGLWGFQLEALKNNSSDACLVGLAEITVCTVLRHLAAVGRSKRSLEGVIRSNFLVDPAVIETRRTSHQGKKLVGHKVARDHKLQVLYRMEVYWLLGNKEDEEECEQEMLQHLRQISIRHAPDEMHRFLDDTMSPSYFERQPEVLCLIYDGLNLARPQILTDLFSPQKR